MSIENLSPRQAAPENADELAKVLSSTGEIKLDYNDHAWDEGPYTVQETIRYIESAPTFLFYSTNTVVGTVSISTEDKRIWGPQDLDAGYIHRLAVTKGNKGLGAQILGWAEDYIKKGGINIARLDCDSANEQLCTYYKSHEYNIVGTVQPGGKDYHAALFEKHLN